MTISAVANNINNEELVTEISAPNIRTGISVSILKDDKGSITLRSTSYSTTDTNILHLSLTLVNPNLDLCQLDSSKHH
jgi:hypothetical protein